jgi:hypothetical protein
MRTKPLVWSGLIASLLVVGAAAGRTFTDSTDIFSGQVGIGPGASNPYGLPYPMSRLDVTGDTNTRVRIDGSTTTGILFTLGGADAGTIRSTANGLEVWTSDNGLVLRLQGNQMTVFGNLHVTGDVQVDGNVGGKYQ